jgi:hypothetical protein
MTTWDLGDRVPLRHRVYDADSQLVDATVSLAVIAPDGTITTPAVTHTSVGTYDTSVLANQAGQWRYIWSVSGTVVDEQTDTFDVGDPAPLLYFGLDRFKRRLSIDPDDPTRDEELCDFLDAASRGIEINTNRRQFWLAPTPTARVYSVYGRVTRIYTGAGYTYVLDIDDIGSTVGMVVEIGSSLTGAWTVVTDYATGPDNALADRRAIETLRRRGGWGCDEVRVTARAGWPAMPAVVQQATQLQASRLNHRRDSPAGFVGTPDIGLVRLGRLDPDVEVLLEKLRKIAIG